jgi:hypothetical protein
MLERTRARELAAEFLANGNPTGWFDDFLDQEIPPVRHFRVLYQHS